MLLLPGRRQRGRPYTVGHVNKEWERKRDQVERVRMRRHSYPAAESWEHLHFAVTEWKTLIQALYSVRDWCIKDWWQQCCLCMNYEDQRSFFLFQIALKLAKYMHKWERKNESHAERARERACELFKQNIVSGITDSGYNLWLVNP